MKRAAKGSKRPSQQELLAAEGTKLRDVISPGLSVVFCGINPSLYSAAVGHHFARPGNRFWPALHAGGFTDRRLDPNEDGRLPEFGCGLTNVCWPATARADQLSVEQIQTGAKTLRRKMRRYQPRFLAVLGVTVYRMAMNEPRAQIGRQERRWGETRLWVLPNPSGLNAHFQAADFARLFGELRAAAFGSSG